MEEQDHAEAAFQAEENPGWQAGTAPLDEVIGEINETEDKVDEVENETDDQEKVTEEKQEKVSYRVEWNETLKKYQWCEDKLKELEKEEKWQGE